MFLSENRSPLFRNMRYSVCGPAAVDGQCHAGDRGRGLARQEDSERAQLLDGGEALIGLLCQKDLADHLLARDAVRLGLAVDLRLDQWSVYVAGADRVTRDALLAGLHRRHLGESA